MAVRLILCVPEDASAEMQVSLAQHCVIVGDIVTCEQYNYYFRFLKFCYIKSIDRENLKDRAYRKTIDKLPLCLISHQKS